MSNKRWRRGCKAKPGEVEGRDFFRSESDRKGALLRRALMGEKAAEDIEKRTGRWKESRNAS